MKAGNFPRCAYCGMEVYRRDTAQDKRPIERLTDREHGCARLLQAERNRLAKERVRSQGYATSGRSRRAQ